MIPNPNPTAAITADAYRAATHPTPLSVYHTRRVAQARQRIAELRATKTTQMSDADLFKWLTRMEIIAGDLLNVVDLLTGTDAR